MSRNEEILRLIDESIEIDGKLFGKHPDESSLKIYFGHHAAKYALVCAASKLEAETKIALRDIFSELLSDHAPANRLVANFIQKNILKRGYNGLFGFPNESTTNESITMNAFYAKFGSAAKEFFCSWEKNDEKFKEASHAFLSIGGLRNQLVHGDLVRASNPLSIKDVKETYAKAAEFLPKFKECLRKYVESLSQNEGEDSQ